MPDALIQLGERGPDGLRAPFRAFAADYQSSGRFDQSLDLLKDRLADPTGDRVVEALRIAREVGGGDLGRVLRSLSAFLRDEPIDVLQITYNLADERAEPVMRLAAERGVAVVINRPLDGGALFGAVGNRPLPAWTTEFDCANWAQFFLKWIVAHPAVSCAIPATRNPDHLDENMGAGRGRLPTVAQRARMRAALP